jgi:hypothetical protein
MIHEVLAEYAHNAWSGWMKYMFGKSVRNADSSVTIPPELVQRWERQMNTSYKKLPALEQRSDREEATKILELVTSTDWLSSGEPERED